MKIGVLGAGITGLSIAKLLHEKYDVELLESKPVHGGIARTITIDGATYHPVGGHCFNSKYPDVLDFVFNNILPFDQWRRIERNSAILFKKHEIGYPIEFSIKQIYGFDKELAIRITTDFLNAIDDNDYDDLEVWFRKKFGNALSEEYFIPYNKKIWNKEPKLMSHSWVEDKLPIPNKESFFEGLISEAKDNMSHSFFYYPKTNNQNTFIDSLALNLSIKYDTEVLSIRLNSKRKWIINDEFEYDIIISTLPLNEVPYLIENTPEEILNAASKLKYNSVSNVFWASKKTQKTWTYLPDNNTPFHRYIHIGSYFEPIKGYTITESIGEKTIDELISSGLKDSFLKCPLASNKSKHAYVVFDDNYKESTFLIKNYLKSIGIHSIGRFGEWEYYNMDVCIKKCIDLAKQF